MTINRFSLIILLLVCTLSNRVLQPSMVSLDTQDLSVEKFDEFWKITFKCMTQRGSCSLNFPVLPQGWTTQGQKIQIPIDDVLKVKAYFVKAEIRISTGQQVIKQIGILFSYENIAVTTRDEPSQGSYESSNAGSGGNMPESFITKNSQQLNWYEENGIKPFNPSIDFLQETIKKGDSVQFVILLQNIFSDQSLCSKKIDYLKRVANLLQKYISSNEKMIQDQLLSTGSSKIRGLLRQREQVMKDLDRASNQGSELEERKEKLREEVKEGKQKYNSYVIIASRYKNVFEDSVEGTEVTPEKLIEIIQQIKEDQNQIPSVLKQYREIEKKKNMLERRLQKNRRIVKDATTAGGSSQAKVANLQGNFKKFNDLANESKAKYEAAERQLRRISRINPNSNQVSSLQQKLNQIQKQIDEAEKASSKDDSVKELEKVLSTLKENADALEDQIQRCQDEPEPQKVSGKPKMISKPKEPPTLYRVQFTSILWANQYGLARTSNNCGKVKRPSSDSGRIVSIRMGTIRVVTDNGSTKVLTLGICSKLEAEMINFVPRPGDRLDWDGDKESPILVNLLYGRFYRE